jgi:hypothetical protein
MKDPWRVAMSTDHPNGGSFLAYPEIVQLLMDVEFRKAQVRQLPEAAQQRIVLGDLDRQYSLYEIAIITSAGPARALGMTNKGHLGVGADADVAIYPEKPNEDGLLFSYPRYVLKDGQIVVEEGDVIGGSEGREFIVRPEYDKLIADNPIGDYAGAPGAAMAAIYAGKLKTKPGAAFEYSDVSFIVLGELVKTVGGEPVDAFAKRHVFDPLGMSSTAIPLSPPLRARSCRMRTSARCRSTWGSASGGSTISSRWTAARAMRSPSAATRRG